MLHIYIHIYYISRLRVKDFLSVEEDVFLTNSVSQSVKFTKQNIARNIVLKIFFFSHVITKAFASFWSIPFYLKYDPLANI